MSGKENIANVVCGHYNCQAGRVGAWLPSTEQGTDL